MTQLEKLFSQLDELRRLERYLRYLTKVNEENLLEMRSHIDDSFAQIQIQKRGEDLPPPATERLFHQRIGLCFCFASA